MIDGQKLREALVRTNGKIEALDKEKYQQLSSSMASLTPREIVAYQEIKSVAQAEGRITLEVALWAYRTIGHWATSPLADKVILTQLIAAWTGAIHR
jgi:hypothetical protein